MAKIIKFSKARRLSRNSGDILRIKRKPYYQVWLRALLPKQKRKINARRIYGLGFHSVQCLGGYRLTAGFTLEMILREQWHRLPYPVRPSLLRDFLEAMDDLCEQGIVQIEVDGQLIGKSNKSAIVS